MSDFCVLVLWGSYWLFSRRVFAFIGDIERSPWFFLFGSDADYSINLFVCGH